MCVCVCAAWDSSICNQKGWYLLKSLFCYSCIIYFWLSKAPKSFAPFLHKNCLIPTSHISPFLCTLTGDWFWLVLTSFEIGWRCHWGKTKQCDTLLSLLHWLQVGSDVLHLACLYNSVLTINPPNAKLSPVVQSSRMHVRACTSPSRMHTRRKVHLSERPTRGLCWLMFIQLIVGTNSSDTVAGSHALPLCSCLNGNISPVLAFIIYMSLAHASPLCEKWAIIVGEWRLVAIIIRNDQEQHMSLRWICVCAKIRQLNNNMFSFDKSFTSYSDKE